MKTAKILLILLVTLSSYNLIAQKLTGSIGVNYGLVESIIYEDSWNKDPGIHGRISYHFDSELALSFFYLYRWNSSSLKSSQEANGILVRGLDITRYFKTWNKGFSISGGIHSSRFINTLGVAREKVNHDALGFSLSAAYAIPLFRNFSIEPKYTYQISRLIAQSKKMNSHAVSLSMVFKLFG